MDREDALWAAKQVAAFRDAEIRAIVQTGGLSDPRAVEWVARCLAERRDKIVRAFMKDTLPLDAFRVRDGQLHFVDLSPSPKEPGEFRIQWSVWNNMTNTGSSLPITGPDVSAALAAAGDAEYITADIKDPLNGQPGTRIYLRRDGRNVEVVGIERHR
jgi:hypothetical protein